MHKKTKQPKTASKTQWLTKKQHKKDHRMSYKLEKLFQRVSSIQFKANYLWKMVKNYANSIIIYDFH
jgi:hypothetical protein